MSHGREDDDHAAYMAQIAETLTPFEQQIWASAFGASYTVHGCMVPSKECADEAVLEFRRLGLDRKGEFRVKP